MNLARRSSASLVLLLGAALSGPALGQGDLIPSGLVDPPLYITNLGDSAVELAWQTTRPGVQLSPPRSATVAAGADAKRIDPGLYWIVAGDDDDAEVMVDNVVFLSVLDDNGSVRCRHVHEPRRRAEGGARRHRGRRRHTRRDAQARRVACASWRLYPADTSRYLALWQGNDPGRAMSSETAAIARLDEAIARLEAAAANTAGGQAERIAALEADNRRLAAALEDASSGQAALEGRVKDVSGRLDGVIGELKSVLGR